MDAVNLKQKLDTFTETWSPKIVGELNGQYVKLVKCEGEYVWHAHQDEDEMFLVLEGRLELHFRNRIVTLETGEFCIIPRTVEHKPVAKEPCSVALFEPAGTRNTGDVDHEYTMEATDLERI